VLYVAWLFVGKLGAGTLVDFLEHSVFENYLNPWATSLVSFIHVQFVRDLLVGHYGVITMALTYAIAIILPVVVTFSMISSTAPRRVSTMAPASATEY